MIILTDWIVLVVSWRGEINMVSLNKRDKTRRTGWCAVRLMEIFYSLNFKR